MKPKTPQPRRRALGVRTSSGGSTALDHYHREKARRVGEVPNADLLAAAKREYQALLAAEALKGKGGRPKKQPAAVNPDAELDPSELDPEE